jgi:hypothetical protein
VKWLFVSDGTTYHTNSSNTIFSINFSLILNYRGSSQFKKLSFGPVNFKLTIKINLKLTVFTYIFHIQNFTTFVFTYVCCVLTIIIMQLFLTVDSGIYPITSD